VAINQATQERLAFIRYVHRHAIEQSRLPEAQSYVSILLLHDAMETMLLLVADRFGVAAGNSSTARRR
jgi:hypothetical protein